MKVLSLTQPWASLCVIVDENNDAAFPGSVKLGIKDWETRSWMTTYRGELLIHASKEYDRATIDKYPFSLFKEKIEPLPTGAIIGKVNLVSIISTTRWLKKFYIEGADAWEIQKGLGDYNPYRYAWKFIEPVKFAFPIETDGSLSVWNYEIPESVTKFLNAGNGSATVSPMIDQATWDGINKLAEMSINFKLGSND